MIIPMVCFSCGAPISHLWLPYTQLVKEYELELPIEEQKDGPISDGVNKSKPPSPEFRALAKLGIARDCDRRMFLSEHPMYTKVR